MNYTVIVTNPAEDDLFEAMEYISQKLKNPPAVGKLLAEFERAVDKLETVPKLHKVVDDDFLAEQGFRSMQIGNYLLFYIINEETQTVAVQRFLYARRDWPNII